MAWPLRGDGDGEGKFSALHTPFAVSSTCASLSHFLPSYPPKRTILSVPPTRCAVPKSRGAIVSDPTAPGMRPIGRHSHVVVSSTHVSPCCCRPVRPQMTKSCLSTATAQ